MLKIFFGTGMSANGRQKGREEAVLLLLLIVDWLLDWQGQLSNLFCAFMFRAKELIREARKVQVALTRKCMIHGPSSSNLRITATSYVGVIATAADSLQQLLERHRQAEERFRVATECVHGAALVKCELCVYMRHMYRHVACVRAAQQQAGESSHAGGGSNNDANGARQTGAIIASVDELLQSLIATDEASSTNYVRVRQNKETGCSICGCANTDGVMCFTPVLSVETVSLYYWLPFGRF
jgi:hypothetical protein